MSRTVTGQDAVQAAKRVKYSHGLLKPITAVYYKWAEKDANKNKIEGTGGEVEYEEWVKLPENRRGQKWNFEVDPTVLRPDLQWTVNRGVMVGFQDWNSITLPSILDTIGQGDKSVGVFADRANEMKWYVESEMVFTGYYNDKPQDTHKFIRMTQDLNELKVWNTERYPKQEVVVPEDLVEQAKALWLHPKFANKNPDKFNQMVSSNEELNPYLVQLAEQSKSW